jgi:DNA-directed RNA polymerase specialized sigma24 family protein
MREIIVDVAPDGQTTVTTQGFVGTSCKEATKELEAALGKVESDKSTAEAKLRATDSRVKAR